MSRFLDLTGRKFGRLTVIERVVDYTSPGGHRSVRWRCRCICGGETITSTYKLKSGHTTSCGCYKREMSSEYHIKRIPVGTVFHYLTVLEESSKNGVGNGYLWYKCQCKCGNVVEVNGHNLRSGDIKSCGCYRRILSSERRQKLIETGTRFGRLVVLGESDKNIIGSGDKYFKCICDCGNPVEVMGALLRSGSTQSCGCLLSKHEEIIASILEQEGTTFNRQYSFEDCRDKQKLKFDFALLKNDECIGLIEYDGRQHYQSVEYFGGEAQLKYTQKHDETKSAYCKENDIPLLRIPYWDKKNIASLVINFIKEAV